MTPTLHDWRIDFMRSHSRLFEVFTDEPDRSFGYPLCEEGWRDVLQRLCTRIESALRADETVQFVRIKQKFGLMRIDWDGGRQHRAILTFLRPGI